MRTEIVVQLGRTWVAYLAVTVTALGLQLAARVSGHDAVATCSVVFGMVAWVAIGALVGADLFGYLHRGNDVLLLLAPWGRGRVVAIKCLVHGGWMLILFIATWVAALADYSDLPVKERVLGSVALAGARALGIATFLVLLAAIIRAVKVFRTTALAAGIAVVVYVLVTVAATAALVRVAVAVDGFWALGIGSEIVGAPQYVNLVPVLVGSPDAAQVIDVHPAAVVLNAATLGLALGVWWLLQRVTRVDDIG